MANIVVVGIQWGDEGKGKIVDYLSRYVDIVARYQGGHNAGHTVLLTGNNKSNRQVILHLIPTGILRPGKKCVIGNGVVVDPKALLEEMNMLTGCGIDYAGRLFISHRAHLILPYHRKIEQEEENSSAPLRRIGTTGRGIGPAYVDKMSRSGIMMTDLLDKDLFREKLRLNSISRGLDDERLSEQLTEEYCRYGEQIKPYLADTSALLNQAIDQGESLLFEGAQGTLLDIDHGTYPYVTSSSATAGGACTGTGVGPTKITGALGVVKAYTTRVGHGPFPTELQNEMGEKLRRDGGEYGATTGRPRRCGWFDAVAVRYAVRLNGVEALALTKLDVLDDCPRIKICVGYSWRGETLVSFPDNLAVLQECRPVYEEMPGWLTTTQGISRYSELPERTRNYLQKIQELAGADAALISTGPGREQTILTDNSPLKNWLGIA